MLDLLLDRLSPQYCRLRPTKTIKDMPSLPISEFEFEDGSVLKDVSIRYDTWGALNSEGDNAVIVCHTLTGNTDVSEWWGPMLGPGRALDPEKHFVVCAAIIGSPYGDLSPLTIDPSTSRRYGSRFPDVTVRDTVRLHRVLLEHLGVKRVSFAIGSSLGAMQVLEWAFYGNFIKGLVAIAVGGRHSAWSIGWSESQRHCIYADPKWDGGDYDPQDPPAAGLAAARMVAMISYRSAFSYQQRFGRKTTEGDDSLFEVESYLRYQGRKLVDRFDAGCYVSLTKQMNRHDVSRDRGDYASVIAGIRQPALLLGITSDILYPLSEQRELAQHMPNARLDVIDSPHGHDAFLIELDELNRRVLRWRTDVLETEYCNEEAVRWDAA